VDDDAQVLAVTRTMLEVLGMRVIVARNGREAITLGVSHAHELRIVLMDLTMPELNGEEAVRELRARGVNLPVLLVSGYSEHEARGRLVGHGPCDFLQKPFGLTELRNRLSELLH
jgi:CheY-like chemotaxis protein